VEIVIIFNFMCLFGVDATTIYVTCLKVSPSIGIYLFEFYVRNTYTSYYFMWSANIYIQYTHVIMRIVPNLIPWSNTTVNLVSLMTVRINYSLLRISLAKRIWKFGGGACALIILGHFEFPLDYRDIFWRSILLNQFDLYLIATLYYLCVKT
jgi:hypothetical protein